jgi:hypothetical protein
VGLRRILGLAVIATCAACAPAGAATRPVQGIFEGCPLDSAFSTCVQRLDVMRAGGFKVVVIAANQTSRGALHSYATEARVRGMSVMWELSDPGWWRAPQPGADPVTDFSSFHRACGCRGTRLATFVARWLGRLPGTYGYYAADDSMLAAGDRRGVQRFVAALKRGDPRHPAMVGAANTIMQRQYVRSADLVGAEIYPVTSGPLDPAATSATAAAAQHNADHAHRASAFILQAFSWGDSLADGQAIGMCSAADTLAGCGARLTYPSSSEQVTLLAAVLHHARPKLVLWWSFPGTYGPAVAPPPDQAVPTPAQALGRWMGLVGAITTPIRLRR